MSDYFEYKVYQIYNISMSLNRNRSIFILK
jgi:hypothetical protein